MKRDVIDVHLSIRTTFEASQSSFSSGSTFSGDLHSNITQHHSSSARNLEQAANLLCAQVNLASNPQQNGKRVVAYGLFRLHVYHHAV